MESELRRLGLSDVEVKVYLASLECASGGVHEIAKRAGISRAYAYEVIEGLIAKGLMASAVRAGKKKAEAADPDKLLRYVKETELMIQAILPDLKKRYSDRPKGPESAGVQVYEGIEGVKLVFDDILAEGCKVVDAYGSITKKRAILRYACRHFAKIRLQRGITVRLLTERTPEATEYAGRDREMLRETRFVDFALPTLTYIYGNKVAVISLEGNVLAVVTRNESMARAQRQLFESWWSASSMS